MPINLLEKNNFQYSKGIFTEATALTRPDGTSIDEEDFVILRNSKRKRRGGWKRCRTGSSYNITDSGLTTFVNKINIGRWENPGTKGINPIVVVRIADHLYFYQDYGSYLSRFPASSPQKMDLRTHRIDRNGSTSVGDIEFTEANSGYFVVTGEDIYPFYLNYEENVPIVSPQDLVVAKEIHIQERDLEGINDGYGDTSHPTVYNSDHEYNLVNAGWSAGQYAAYQTATGFYPAKNQIIWTGKYTNPSTGKEAIDVSQVGSQTFGNTPAPIGKFIQQINKHERVTNWEQSYRVTAVTRPTATELRITHTDSVTYTLNDYVYISGIHIGYRDSSAEEQFVSVQGYFQISQVNGTSDIHISFTIPNYGSAFTDLSEYGASIASIVWSKPSYSGEFQNIDKGFRAVAFHAGRLFFAGMDDEHRNVYGKRVYYSQLNTRAQTKFGNCYSINDPTSEYENEPLETDGGYIVLPEVDTIRKLIPMNNHLIVLADNGVWAIVPGESGYFTSTSYGVVRVSDLGVSVKESVVYAGGNIFYWSNGGIYIVSQDEITGNPKVQSATDTTIKSLIIDQVNTSVGVQGVYDSKENILYWLYNDNTTTGSVYVPNKLLVLDLIGQSFYKLSCPTTYEDANNQSIPIGITVGDPLIWPDDYPSKTYIQRRLRVLRADLDTTLGETITWYYTGYTEPSYGDFIFDADYTDDSPVTRFQGETVPYLVTSYEYGNGPNKKKWGKTVHCYFDRTEDAVDITAGGDITLYNKGGCQMRARWDFADTDTSNKWSPSQQVYRLQRFYMPTDTPPGEFAWENGYPVVKTKNKVRGQGDVLSLRFDGESGKHCDLIGWSIDLLETSESR